MLQERPPYLAIGKIKTASGYKSLIFAKNATHLYAYDPLNPSTYLWRTAYSSNEAVVGLADFNHDGWTEVYLGNAIFDAATGYLLCDGGSNNKGTTIGILHYFMAPQAYDIIGDSRLELIAGNQIYDVVITDRANSANNSMTVIKTVTPPTANVADGLTVVADFDNDGKLEVLVRSRDGNSNNIYLYLWTPHTATPEILASLVESSPYFGIPFVGDIDGNPDGLVEIISLTTNGTSGITQTNRFNARRYNASTHSFETVWNANHTDQSGGTGMTLFDFDQDGKNEIVYRDEKTLRVIDGSVNPPETKASFDAYSETFHEYPVVADVFGSGHANIIVTSDYKTLRKFAGLAQLKIFGALSPEHPWAPAREVWNQYSYNPVAVNSDLTIPQYPASPAIVLPGADNLMGTGDDLRPYNNFLQQATTLSVNGEPIWLLPDVEPVILANTYDYYAGGDSLVVHIKIANEGDAALMPPFYIAAYKDEVTAANNIAVDSVQQILVPNDTLTATLTIRNLATHLPLDSVIIRVNDRGLAAFVQDECDSSNNSGSFKLDSIMSLQNDYDSICTNASVNIDILANDGVFACATPEFGIADSTSRFGVWSLNPADSSLLYTSTGNSTGTDSLWYYVRCGSWRSLALALVKVRQCIELHPDTANTLVNTPVFIDILTNDTIFCAAGTLNSVHVSSAMPPLHGTANIVFAPDTTLQYTPANGWYGIDSLRYLVADCNGATDSTEVYIVTHKPLADAYFACEDGVVTLGFEHIDSIRYYWYDAQTGGTLVKASSDTLIVTKGSAADLGEWWVEALYNGYAVLPRLRVTLDEYEPYKPSDIRIQVCPNLTVKLSSYIDSLYLNTINWSRITSNAPAITSPEGEINTTGMTAPNTYVYRYVLSSLASPECGTVAALAYVRVLRDHILARTDTVRICKDLDAALALNLNQILGLELDGVWSYPADPDNAIADNVAVAGAGSQYEGAMTFNARQAFADAGASYDLNGNPSEKVFRFRYTAAAGSCAPNEIKDIVVVVY
jgi:hypothetical protein